MSKQNLNSTVASIFSPVEVAAENEVKHNRTIEILFDMMRLLAMMQQKD